MARTVKVSPEQAIAHRHLLERVLGEMLERLQAGARLTEMSFHEDPTEDTIHYHVDLTFARESFETRRTERVHMKSLAAELRELHAP